ncbi:MAG: STAS domain-containing protein [Chloroflexota bacterium]
MATLSINTRAHGNASIVTVDGRVDSETAPDLDSALSKLLANANNKIVLNLQGVDYFSSAGLRALVKALKSAQGSGGDLRLASVSQPIEVILRTVGMMQMFKMFPTSEEAAAGF